MPGLLLLTLAGSLYAQETLKASTGISSLYSTVPLFTISWSLSKNVVHYDAKLKNGIIDPKDPIDVYWVMNQKDGHREGLTLIERLKAYGISVKPGKDPNTYDMVIVSVKQKTLHVYQEDGKFRVTLPIANCETAYLDHVQVQAHKWHMLNIPDYAELFGNDAKTGEECRERVKQE
ncbi:MAG: DUF4833 domain-containing protein [Bryobacteraceae bacterium]